MGIKPGSETAVLLNAALEYARKGIAVFPCNPVDKRPLVKGGFKAASTEEQQVQKWWAKWPVAMIGVPTGKQNGFWAVDPDVVTAPSDPDGLAAWRELSERHGEVSTRTHRTPSGGLHLLWKWNPEDNIRNSTGSLPRGIDVRGEGGYVIFPPSRTSDGRQYQVIDESRVGEAPQWLLDQLQRKRESPRDNINLRDRIISALGHIPSDDYHVWFEIGAALRRELGEAGFSLFDGWSSKSAKYDRQAVQRKWSQLADVTEFTAATIFHYRDKFDPGSKGNGGRPLVRPALDMLLKDAAQLQSTEFAPLKWIVPNYLPEGLSVLAGKPKVGKSWLALDVAVAVSTGGDCFGRTCSTGNVLGLFLEDTDRRLRRRLQSMLGDTEWPRKFQFATEWPRLHDGGLALIKEWVNDNAEARLVIVDILQRVRPNTKSAQQTQYGADYEALTALQQLAGEAGISVLVLHHQRKLAADDMIDTISGTLGIGGVADTVAVLGQDQEGKFLYARGRDLEEYVQQNDVFRWEMAGARGETQPSPERSRIVAKLRGAKRPVSVREIATSMGLKVANTKNLLSKLHAAGEVERVSTGMYRLTPEQWDLDSLRAPDLSGV